MKLVYAVDNQLIGTVPFNLCAHLAQQLNKIGNFRLLGSILQNCRSFGEAGCHQQIFCCPDGDCLKPNFRAFKAVGCNCFHIAASNCNFCPHLFKAADMKVHRPRANRASSGQRYAGLANSREERTHDKGARPHFTDNVIGCFGIGDVGGPD